MTDLAASFAPSAARGAALDTAVRARLAASLSAIADAADGVFACDTPAIRALAAHVAAHPVRPTVMLRYAEAVSAIGAGDPDAASAALAALADPTLRAPALPRVTTLRDADLGPGGAAAAARLLDDDPGLALRLAPLDDAALETAAQRVAAAQDLLGPDFAGEIAAVAPEVLAVRPAPDADGGFDGATSFHLWGCVALNVGKTADDVALATALAHETGHAVLFGLTLGGTVVSNPDEERFASPLREDPRPMEGIAHATWVLARMHLAVAGMLESGRLDAAQRALAAQSLPFIARDYAAGLSVMARGARFTPAGEAAFAPAEAYMAGQGVRR